jgi:aryl-alcohol dehydrogenase-like predicted oxidoreductase
MNYRIFGSTGLRVSEICYGTMRYASKTGERDGRSEAAARALEQAVDLGINFIHSSYEYGTRWLTGDVLSRHPKRHELHHIIKINVPEWGEATFDKGVFRRQVEEALRDLKTDRIAVVQHLQRGSIPREIGYCAEGEPKRLLEFDAVTGPLTEEFTKLKKEGKVGFLTSFPYTTGYARRAVESGLFSGLVAFYNVLEMEMLDLFPEMQKQGMGFIGIRPFAAGLLTARRVDRGDLPEGDRLRDPGFDRLYDQLAEFRLAHGEEPADWTRFALRFALSHPVIASTVVGINTPEQLLSAAAAVEDGPVDAAVVQAAHGLTMKFRGKFGVKAPGSGIPAY